MPKEKRHDWTKADEAAMTSLKKKLEQTNAQWARDVLVVQTHVGCSAIIAESILVNAKRIAPLVNLHAGH